MKIELTPKANEIISKVKSELIGNGKQSVAYVSGMQFALTNPELILAQSKDLYGNKLVEALECKILQSSKINQQYEKGEINAYQECINLIKEQAAQTEDSDVDTVREIMKNNGWEGYSIKEIESLIRIFGIFYKAPQHAHKNTDD